MVRTRGKKIPELEGCKVYDFAAKHGFQGFTRLIKRFGLEPQRAAHERIKTALKQFANEPCEVEFCAGVQDGNTFIHGMVWAYDQESSDKSHSIFQVVDREVWNFRATYPGSEFMIYYSQSVKITRVAKD